MKLESHLQPLLLELATAERISDTGIAPAVSAEQSEVDAAKKIRSRARDSLAAAQLAVDDMELEILRIQEEERKMRRRKEDSARQLSAATDRELRKDLEKDLYSSNARISDLTGELQEAHNHIHALRSNIDLRRADLAAADKRVEDAEKALENLGEDTTLIDRASRITEIRQALPADVIAEYEAQRLENGVGAAQFNGRSCGGCFIILPPADLSEIRRTPADELPQCPDCGSYLIRNIQGA
ncbi:C4-type zinc ribbon domain-containing protein [Corynebacterium sp. ES2794-CONJ1]|uniref:zinc ribbon domain-containing protein n=1 Tax=unclassified Corynebacterium TaxID=2624378 RepID=UPI0021681FD3|nr:MULTISPECIES: C4-type zinc ribbon domain-containing protein [unclassified Corynebacterium]MCS4490614.1 C4-type zinc ribbon domain-containing protein [Corynebacterium sp. ES2775-CONJ]MCS4492393.1 C4-type zinc ribbon domain-containing protein [Corynebacterium sp. ES2715-CONJ3]MCU9519810.1 C4-type zinc ribbon domain-containing protein [Corynebacterium sp. ES2794-CONJ1]